FVLAAVLGVFAGRRAPPRRQRLAPVVALAGLLVLAPLYSDNLSVLIPVYIYLMIGAGWNIIGGYTGYGSFGQVAFFGAGAYAMAASIATTENFLGLPAAVGMLIAAATCAVYALLLGFPMPRLRWHYFAISTLTLAIATQHLIT